MSLSEEFVEAVLTCIFRNKPYINEAVGDARDGETHKADRLQTHKYFLLWKCSLSKLYFIIFFCQFFDTFHVIP